MHWSRGSGKVGSHNCLLTCHYDYSSRTCKITSWKAIDTRTAAIQFNFLWESLMFIYFIDRTSSWLNMQPSEFQMAVTLIHCSIRRPRQLPSVSSHQTKPQQRTTIIHPITSCPSSKEVPTGLWNNIKRSKPSITSARKLSLPRGCPPKNEEVQQLLHSRDFYPIKKEFSWNLATKSSGHFVHQPY